MVLFMWLLWRLVMVVVDKGQRLYGRVLSFLSLAFPGCFAGATQERRAQNSSIVFSGVEPRCDSEGFAFARAWKTTCSVFFLPVLGFRPSALHRSCYIVEV